MDEQLEETGKEVRARLQRDLPSISVAPYARYRAGALDRMRRSRPFAIVGAVAAAVTVIVLALALGSLLQQARRNVAGSPTPTGVPASPTESPTPSPSPTPLPSGRPVNGIEAYALGALHGEYAFVLNGGANTGPGAIAEVWAVPLGGGAPRLAVRYVNATTPSTNTGDNMLARQFSPDGRRLVLAAGTGRSGGGERVGLFIVDLEAGGVQPIGTDNDAEYEKPAWSPDGKRIAYVRRTILGDGRTTNGVDDGIWVMNVDGSGVRKVSLAGAPSATMFLTTTHLYSWTPDGRIAWFYESLENVLVFTDVDSGTSTAVRAGVGDARGLSFRTTAPRIAGSFSDRPGNCPGHYVAVLDGAPERVLVRAPDAPQCPRRIHDVRWNPKSDELLYVLESTTSELHVQQLSGANQRIAASATPVLAEWSPTGTHLLYINRTSAQQTGFPFHGEELHYVRSDGSDDRTIFAPPRTASLSDLATRSYP